MNKVERILLSVLVLIVITIYAFLPSIKNGFINLDDPDYIIKNTSIHEISFANIKTIFTSGTTGLYQPFVNLSYMLEYHFFGADPAIYHATNVILHVLNTCLVFWLILLLDGNILVSLLTALLFGIHPLRVESVAWVAERKDVLYSFFYLLALIDYCKYIKNNNSKGHYYRSLIFFFLSLGSKAMAVTLPVVFFVIDYFLGRKLSKKTFLEKAPFLIMSAVFSIAAIFLQLGHGEGGVSLKQLLVPFYSISIYLYKIFLPIKLSLVYLYPTEDIYYYLICLTSFLLICFMCWFVLFYKRSERKVGFGLIFAFITILPVLQIVTNNTAIMAEHYTYLPSVGISYILSAGFLYFYNTVKNKRSLSFILIGVLFIVLSTFFILTQERVKIWKDARTIFTDVYKKYPYFYAGYHMGTLTTAEDDLPQAIVDYTKFIENNPQHVRAYNIRGILYARKGDLNKALLDFNKAIELKPDFAEAYRNRGYAFALQDRLLEAYADSSKAIDLDPKSVDAYMDRGRIYEKQGKYSQAILEFSKAIEIDRFNIEGYKQRGFVYNLLEDHSQAILNFTKAIDLYIKEADSFRKGWFEIKKVYTTLELSKMSKIAADLAQIYINRANIYFLEKDYPRSWQDVHQAQALGYKVDPDFIEELKKH